MSRGSAAHEWHVLGFTADDIIGAWQDARLAEACVAAWRAGGEPAGFTIWNGAGAGEHLIHWYVTPDVAAVLDRGGVEWRQFEIARVADLPEHAVAVVNLGGAAAAPAR